MTDISFRPGVSRGATESDRPGRWYDSNNIRWRDGRLLPLGGTERISATPLSSPIRQIYMARDNTDIPRTFLGQDNALTMLEGSTYLPITPTAFQGVVGGVANGFGVGPYGAEAFGTPRSVGDSIYTRANNWSLDSFGQDVLAVSASDGRLLRWSAASPTAAATVVANAPTSLRGMSVSAERHVIVITGRRVAWSDRESASGWTYSDVNGQAGFIDLLDVPSMLVCIAKVRDGNLLFSEGSVDLLQYVNAPLYYGTHRVGSGTTLMSPNTVAAFGGSATWMGINGFWLYDGGNCSPLPCEVAAAVFGDDPVYGLDPLYSKLFAFASHHGGFQEIWFHYCSKGSMVPNRTVVWNYSENWWALHNTLKRTAMCSAGVLPNPLAAGSDGHLYQMDTSGFTDAGTPRVGTVYVESNSLSPGGQALITRGEMDSGTGNPQATRITVRARGTREGPATTFGPYSPQATSGWTPMRAGGTDVRLRVEAAVDGPFSIGQMRFSVAPIGNR